VFGYVAILTVTAQQVRRVQKYGGTGQRVDPPDPRSPGASHVDYPTVLVARDDDGLDGPIVHFLQRHGFHVLEADSADLFDVVRVHSRPIHVLLADVSMEAHVPFLKKHRSGLQVVFVKKPVDADDVLAKVRQVLGSPPPSPSSIR
jgi:hypothetical protein